MDKDDNNQTVSAIARFLINDEGSDLHTPYKEDLPREKLDYTLESLKIVDSYLEKIMAKKSTLSDDQYTKVILRCGAYAGEVIRKATSNSYDWIDYDSAIEVVPDIKKFEKSPLTHWLLIQKNTQAILFPMNKVYKFLENGVEDSLHFFAEAYINESKN